MQPELSAQRRFTTPLPGEDWEAIAGRVMPGAPTTEAIERLKSWNLHLLARMPSGVFTGCDVLFVEAPRQPGASLVGAVDLSTSGAGQGA